MNNNEIMLKDGIEKLYISRKQAALRYGLSASFIAKLMWEDNDFPPVMHAGRRILIPLSEFDEYMKKFICSKSDA